MAQWSKIWSMQGITRFEKALLLDAAKNTPPTVRKAKPGGKFPHVQPAK